MPPSDEPIDPIDPVDQYEQFIPQPLPDPHGKLRFQLLLLALTLVTTTLAGGCHYDSFVVDMSTISPSATRAFAEPLRESDVSMLDCPVSGGSERAN